MGCEWSIWILFLEKNEEGKDSVLVLATSNPVVPCSETIIYYFQQARNYTDERDRR